MSRLGQKRTVALISSMSAKCPSPDIHVGGIVSAAAL